MSEQITRRSNNVTSAPFEAPFETSIVRFGRGTLNLKDSLDAMEGWARLTNIWHQEEGEATVRPGQTSGATHGGGVTCHSVRKLRDPQGATLTRLWGVGTTLQRGTTGATSPIATGFSGDPLALLPHRPPFSGAPWMFVGDRTKMVKVREDGLVVPIGLPKPATPTSAWGHEYSCVIAMCDVSDGTSGATWTPAPGKDVNGHATSTPAVPTDIPGPIAGNGIYGVTLPGASVDSAYDSWWGHSFGGTRNLTTLVEVGGPGTLPVDDNDICHVWMLTSHPAVIAEIRLYVVIGGTWSATVLPGTDTGAAPNKNTDAYVKAFRPNDYAQFVQAQTEQVQAAEQARIYALRDADSKGRSYNDTRPGWKEDRARSDPARARSYQLGLAANQWFGFGSIGSSFRRGDFQRIGSDQTKDWSTAIGIILYVRTRTDAAVGPIAIALDDWYFTGGFNPDTVEPGAQMYDYKVTNYDPRTGAESNGSDPQTAARTSSTAFQAAPIDTVRRQIQVTPTAYGDAAIRQRVYRRGGSLVDDWYFVGMNSSDGGIFTDTVSDVSAAASGGLPTDHYQPVPTVDSSGNTVLAQPVRALWGPLEGMLLACGDPYRPGHVYYSDVDRPDHWSSAGNVEVCAPSEELMNGGIAGHQAFVFSRLRLHLLYPNLSGGAGVTSLPSLCTRGLLGYWSFCVGPGGVVYFVATDGVFATTGGPETWLSEVINPLFYGTAVNGYQPIDKNQPNILRLTVWENDLYFLYQDTGGNRQVLVYSILNKFWRHYNFARAIACVQGEDEDTLVMGGYLTGASYSHSGTSDDGTAIACRIRTGSQSFSRREEKLFGDLFVDVMPASVDLSVQIYLNEETTANVVEHVTGGSTRQRFLIKAFGDNPQKAHSIATDISWSSSSGVPILYQAGVAITLQPDITNTRVTNWDDLNSPDEVWLTGLTIDVDTGNLPKVFHVERDFQGTKYDVATFTVTSDNRHKFKFSWPAVSANMVRIRPDTAGCVPWLLYRADWIYKEEPPRIANWDIHFENKWDSYYTGLDLYCNTFGQQKWIQVWVDEVQLQNTLAGLSYWPITTTGRQVVHLTLPWGRGHVFRFLAIDGNPGLLYTHRWHLQEEPSEQANWNQNFSILGTHADKWLKAIIFECDTFGQNKTVNVEVDGSVVETLTVNTNGRRVVQLALPAQHLGRVWRMFPVDGNPGRLYTAEPIFDEEPFQLARWETQETNHGIPGWFYPLYGHITVKSTADVILSVTMQYNQTGGSTTATYTIPSTGGQKQRRFLNGFQAGKGVLIKYVLTSANPFWLYRDETSIIIQPWGAYASIEVKPFGNDDLDPSRPMTHAVLAAQASGGAESAGAGE